MSKLGPRISRRKLIQMTGLAPLAAFAANPALSAEVAAALAEIDPIPAATMTELVKLGKAAKPSLRNSDVGRFEEVSNDLWLYFQLRLPETITIPDPNAVLLAGYRKRGKRKNEAYGDRIVKAMRDWNRDTGAIAYICASKCGEIAAKIAPNGKIDVETFERAWDDTEGVMLSMVDRARKFSKDPDEEGIVRVLGVGC